MLTKPPPRTAPLRTASARFDVAVLGAGPAGGAAALTAAQAGLSVLLLDPAPADADKPCGEGILPGGLDVLAGLGLCAGPGGLFERGRAFHGFRHVVPGAPDLEVDLPRPGLALRRSDLAAALERALEAAPGITRRASAGSVARAAHGFTVAAEGLGTVEAAALIVADGAYGRGAPWLRGRPAARPAAGRVGLRARHVDREGLDRVEVHMGGGCEVYLTPLPDRVLNVAVLFERVPAGRAQASDLLAFGLACHPRAAARLGAQVTPPAVRALSAPWPRHLARGGAFLAGDAGGAVDPILGCGVTIALRTGRAAAEGVQRLASGRAPAGVERAYAVFFRRERRARHVLACALRLGDGHPRLARGVASLLGRLPGASRLLARIAVGR